MSCLETARRGEREKRGEMGDQNRCERGSGSEEESEENKRRGEKTKEGIQREGRKEVNKRNMQEDRERGG